MPEMSSSVTISGAFRRLCDVVANLAQLGHDALVGQPSKGRPEVNANDLAEHAGINSFLHN